MRRITGQPDAVLLGASAACLAGLLLVALFGVPPYARETLRVTQGGASALDLAEPTLEVRSGTTLLAAPGITPQLFEVSLERSDLTRTGASLSAHQYLLAGPVLADVEGTDPSSKKRLTGRAVLHIGGGIVSVPGIAGLALVLFAAAYAESLLRAVRRRRRARATTLAGMALVGAVLGIGVALVGWTLGSHLLSLPLLLVAALLGDAAALALTIVVSRRDPHPA